MSVDCSRKLRVETRSDLKNGLVRSVDGVGREAGVSAKVKANEC